MSSECDSEPGDGPPTAGASEPDGPPKNDASVVAAPVPRRAAVEAPFSLPPAALRPGHPQQTAAVAPALDPLSNVLQQVSVHIVDPTPRKLASPTQLLTLQLSAPPLDHVLQIQVAVAQRHQQAQQQLMAYSLQLFHTITSAPPPAPPPPPLSGAPLGCLQQPTLVMPVGGHAFLQQPAAAAVAAQAPPLSMKRAVRCETCDRLFSDAATLKRHTRAHTGEKPYRCRWTRCSKAFADPSNAKRHEQTHINRRGCQPYACPVGGCRSSFSRRDALQVHLTSQHACAADASERLAGLVVRRQDTEGGRLDVTLPLRRGPDAVVDEISAEINQVLLEALEQ